MKQFIYMCSCYKPIFLFFGLSVVTQNINAHGDELELELTQIESIQVSGGISGPLEATLSLKDIKEPFIKRLTKKGIKIDQNNHEYVISTNGQIHKTSIQNEVVYAVKISFHYSEPCSSFRSNVQLQCNLWEHFESLKFFYSPKDVKKYIKNAVDSTAELFLREFK